MEVFTTMDLETTWKLVSEIVLPLIAAYAAYLHRALANAMVKIESLENKIYEDRIEVAKTYVTRQTLLEFDTKMSKALERIDDKVTKLLEGRK